FGQQPVLILIVLLVEIPFMARPLRIEYPGVYYHVTTRGNERKAISRDDRDREKLLELLARAVKYFHLRLHGYVLMSNHYHLLVETPRGGLRTFVRFHPYSGERLTQGLRRDE